MLTRPVTTVDRFFPNCVFGLVEFVAREKFGYDDIKKAWFSHSFVYRGPSGPIQLTASGVDLDVHLFDLDHARNEARERLARIYGISLDVFTYQDFGVLISEIERWTNEKEILISSFNLGFLKGRREYQRVLRPHAIGVLGMSPDRRNLMVVDQIKGFMEIPLHDYRSCFDHLRNIGVPFSLTLCERKPGFEALPLRREDLRRDLQRSVANLFAESPALGLAGLRQFAEDVHAAARELRVPFAVPGAWVFSHARRCLSRSLRYWSEAMLVPPELIERLRGLLSASFDLWFEADMTIERSLERQDAASSELTPLLRSIIPIEEQTAEVLAQCLAHLNTQ